MQADQIGRFFASWAIFENHKSSPKTLANLFPQQKLCINFYKKLVCVIFWANIWANFWATFSQTHLVTLKVCM
jgi:hypothetical protein